MNGQIFGGREITVVVASESRKRPEEMRTRDRNRFVLIFYYHVIQIFLTDHYIFLYSSYRGSSYGHEGRHSSHYGKLSFPSKYKFSIVRLFMLGKIKISFLILFTRMYIFR